MHNEHKNSNNYTNTKLKLLPLGSLVFRTQSASPIAEMAVASDPTQDRSGLTPAHVPGSQRFCEEKWRHDAASLDRGLKLILLG